MKQSVNFNDFIDAFKRFDRYDAFGYDALRIIFDYLEDYEQSCGEELELDVIAICCDFTVDTIENIVSNYSIDVDGLDEDEKEQEVEDYLTDCTRVLGKTDDGQIVYQVF
jgi:hypothetical protein